MVSIGKTVGLLFALVLFAALSDDAQADAIDGDWCFKDGRTFSIRGPQIVTPKGTAMTGDYDRHAFVYVVPPNEPNAGQTVEMVLLNDDDLTLTTGPAGGERSPAEMWHRCNVTS